MTEPISERLRRCSPTTGTCVDAADLIERAYGLLRRDTSSNSPQVQAARKMLLSGISKDGQRRGISYARYQFGEVSTDEYCPCQNVSPDQRIKMQMQTDDLQARAENAEAELKSLRDRLDRALGSYENNGNRTLLLERLHELNE